MWSYVSDGPYKTYQLKTMKQEFKHRTNKEITGLSFITIILIQALKTLGKENVNDKVCRILSRRITENDKKTCLKEATEATGWVFDTICKICKGEFYLD